MFEQRGKTASPGYQFAMLVLCLYALAVLAAQSVIWLSPGTRTILDYADYVVCAIFFADFLVSLQGATNRWQYLRTWGWLDLLSSIPMIDVARWGRIARVVRVFRVMRGLRATKLLAGVGVRRRAVDTVLAAGLVGLLLVGFCRVGVLHFETSADSNIRSPDDALWWAFATITTVGYGDRFPVTGEGRVIATILMVAGVGLFGTFSGFLAAWFLGHGTEGSADDGLTEIRQELVELKAAVHALGENRPDGPLPPASGVSAVVE
jgi:voltage-gated potassium channel